MSGIGSRKVPVLVLGKRRVYSSTDSGLGVGVYSTCPTTGKLHVRGLLGCLEGLEHGGPVRSDAVRQPDAQTEPDERAYGGMDGHFGSGFLQGSPILLLQAALESV